MFANGGDLLPVTGLNLYIRVQPSSSQTTDDTLYLHTFVQNHHRTLHCDESLTVPSVVGKDQIKKGISRRMNEIVKLNAQIRDLEVLQQQKTHEEEERLRPILDELHAQVVILQQQMAQHWNDHEVRVVQSRQDTQIEIPDIETKITALEQEHNYAISLLAPIRRLPTEILAEILTVAIKGYGCSAIQLTHVCRSWRLVLLATSRIWSKVKVGSRTSTEKVECLLERTGRVTLDVEIDTESDSTTCILGPCQSYSALVILASTSMRWRNLTIGSFPKEERLLELETPEIPLTFNGPLEGLESFRMTRPCEMNTALRNLIDLTRKVENSKLTILELSSASALYRFAEGSSTVFCRLRVFKADLTEMRDPLDILRHFQCLEDMYIHRLHLPLYSDTVHLPLIGTLKRLFLKRTSIQWMNNRTFPRLVECVIIWPDFQETPPGHSGVDIPACTSFTYDDHLLQPLGAFKLPSVVELVVWNEAWSRTWGSQQIGFIWGPNVSMERILKPRVLHLDTNCYNQHLITALSMIPQVEELVLGLIRPGALGKKFLLAMSAKKGKGNRHPTRNVSGGGVSGGDSGLSWTVSLCPNLRIFGLKFRRWLGEHEVDELSPLFRRIVETRSKSNTPLQSLKVWPTKDTTEQQARELVT